MSESTEIARRMELSPSEAQDPEEAGGLVRLALERNVPVEVLERLVALQERVTERNAELAMAQALAAFQAECPPVPRVATAEVKKNGVKQYEYHFAPLEKIVEVIRPHLTRHGLSYTHDGEVGGGAVTVRCTLHHIDGATRSATFSGPTDTSGGKNPIQQVASARSYGRRYTLIDVLGLITEEDDDGVGAGGGAESATITDSQLADLEALIQESGADRKKFLGWLGIERLQDLPATGLQAAVSALEEKRRKAT